MRSSSHQDADDAANAATDAANTVASKATDAANTVADKATDGANTVAGKATDAANTASQKLEDTADAVSQKVGDAVDQGKDWLQSIDVDQLLEQIPQPLRDLGSQVVARVRSLSPTQQIAGGAILAFSIGLLTTHSSRKARHADAKAGKKYRAKYD
ncbi:hypothetical protein [Hymenobacter coccineus]|uniref:DUF3618 domain-containing protein n=1 Tax=Hymenobacter coccineus TaxID=1908235 RepID=A0A1G1TMA2_9BACT|nr:hypothetical protein [Hymenobacter coccineus]OGX92004.1 hypothetical protein BEN49_17745 [Hymenobacter coccineus]